MITRCLFRSVLNVLLLTVSLSAAETTPLQPKPYHGELAQRFARIFPYQHLRQVPLDDRISAQAWTNYLAALDYERVYFVQDDIESFEKYRLVLDDQLRAGKLDFAFEAFSLFRQRVANRSSFVTNQLAKGFDFSDDETYEWKRKKADWPGDLRARDELWRKRLKHEMLRHKVAKIVSTNAPANSVTTNAPASTGGNKASTNLVTGAEGSSTHAPPFDPEEAIAKRYKQFWITLADSDAEWVVEKFMTSVSMAFDPHSSYMSPSSLEDFEIDMKLSLVGIGALLRSEDGAAKIVSIIPGGPASRDKRPKALKPGDKIIGVGQGDGPVVDVLHWPLYKIVRLIRGEKGTTVVLHVIDGSDPAGVKTRMIDIVRDEVKLEEQAASYAIREVDHGGRQFRLGVIDLPAFYANMHQRSVRADDFRSASYDVAKALREMATNNVDGIVLDLRSNGGGSLREAVNMAGLFIRSGPVVQVREPRMIHMLADEDPRVVWRKPMVVMVNRLSASASEIVAGALQDYGRAVLVGDTRTHGKGSVQTIRNLGDDKKLGSIKVTTASYYRISGGSTQLKGVEPDVVVSSMFDGMDLGEGRLTNPMPWTRVAPTDYEKIDDLSSLIPALRQRSAKRREENPAFQHHDELLERVREVNASETISLELQARVKDAMAEMELDKSIEAQSEEMVPDAKEEENEDEQESKDIVLIEGLKVLADLIMEQGEIVSLSESGDSSEELSNMLFRKVFGL